MIGDKIMAAINKKPENQHLHRTRLTSPLLRFKKVVLIEFKNSEGEVCKFSLDIEEADRSHYEFSIDEMRKLEEKLDGKSLDAELKNEIDTHIGSTASAVADFLDSYGIIYEQFHNFRKPYGL